MGPSPRSTDLVDVEESKVAMRAAAREQRLPRSERLRSEAAEALADQAMTLPELQRARCVSIYASRATEPGTLPLIERLAARGVRVIVPLLGDGLQRGWGDYRGAEDLAPRAPGRPPEPSGDFLPPGSLGEADVVIAPTLAVDPTGTRLGQGGGWYDRALCDARPDALIVVFAYPEEVHEAGEVPREDHDFPVHGVVTPDGVTIFER